MISHLKYLTSQNLNEVVDVNNNTALDPTLNQNIFNQPNVLNMNYSLH